MSAALDVRYLSGLKEDRVSASRILTGPTAVPHVDRAQLVDDVRQALYAAKICSYAQVGFATSNYRMPQYGVVTGTHVVETL